MTWWLAGRAGRLPAARGPGADPATVRRLLMAVEADAATTPDEVWGLRDADRDLYTPALDAVSRLLPAQHRLPDLRAGMVAADGAWLRTTDGRRIDVPASMRAALARQRTVSTGCNGPGDWPLLTVFDEVPSRWS